MANMDPILLEQVNRALLESPHLLPRTVHYETQTGELVLRGRVRSYYEKQMAQETMKRISGLASLVNNLEVL